MKTWKKSTAIVLALMMAAGSLTGCGGSKAKENSSNTGKNSTEDTAGKTSFVFGDTTFNPENEEADVNPHNTYAGWACIRYGIGETLCSITPIPWKSSLGWRKATRIRTS